MGDLRVVGWVANIAVSDKTENPDTPFLITMIAQMDMSYSKSDKKRIFHLWYTVTLLA